MSKIFTQLQQLLHKFAKTTTNIFYTTSQNSFKKRSRRYNTLHNFTNMHKASQIVLSCAQAIHNRTTCTNLHTTIPNYTQLYITFSTVTKHHKFVQHSTPFYRTLHNFTKLESILHTFTQLFNTIHKFKTLPHVTKLYRTTQYLTQLYKNATKNFT